MQSVKPSDAQRTSPDDSTAQTICCVFLCHSVTFCALLLSVWRLSGRHGGCKSRCTNIAGKEVACLPPARRDRWFQSSTSTSIHQPLVLAASNLNNLPHSKDAPLTLQPQAIRKVVSRMVIVRMCSVLGWFRPLAFVRPRLRALSPKSDLIDGSSASSEMRCTCLDGLLCTPRN